MNFTDSLKPVFTCDFCETTYISPVLLPCLEIICQKDIERLKCEEDGRFIKCYFCKSQHQIPDIGFPHDRRMEKMINYNYHRFDLGDINMRAYEACDRLRKLLIDYHRVLDKPGDYVMEHFSIIKSALDRHRIELKKRIDDAYEKCLKKVERAEKICLSKTDFESVPQIELVQETQANLNKWFKILNEPNFNKIRDWEDINDEAHRIIKNISLESHQLKDSLMQNKDYRFANGYLIDKEVFGEIIISDSQVTLLPNIRVFIKNKKY